MLTTSDVNILENIIEKQRQSHLEKFKVACYYYNSLIKF